MSSCLEIPFSVFQKSRPTARPYDSLKWHTVLIAVLVALVGGQAVHAGQKTIPEWKIVVLKQPQLLELYKRGSKVRTYRVCLGLNPVGHKRVTGDKKTPEGDYFICYKSASSRFYRFLGISYPSAPDAVAACEGGLITGEKRDAIVHNLTNGQAPPWDTRLGGWVGIHGYPTEEDASRWALLLFPKPHNWTDGCIAMWNFEIEELFSKVPVGTPVTILP